jgi:hypothetical protein
MAADKQTIFLVDTLTVDVAGTTLGALIPLGGPSHGWSTSPSLD